MNPVVIDIETTIKNTIGNNKGSAFCPDNFIVLFGIKTEFGVYTCTLDKARELVNKLFSVEDDYIFIGHNFKFDMHWIYREIPDLYWLIKRNTIWDTQVVEYMLSAQTKLYPSLDETAPKYGGTTKPDLIKAAWEQGVQTETMDKNALSDYLLGDLENTFKVYKGQVEKAKKVGMDKLIPAIMRGTQAITDMEINGLKIDTNSMDALQEVLQEEYDLLHNRALHILKDFYRLIPSPFINLDSTLWLQAILYGGKVSYVEKEQIGFYKSGKKKGEKKYRNVEVEKTLDPIINFTPLQEWANAKGFSTKEEALKIIRNQLEAEGQDFEFVDILLRLRWLTKQINTYCQGMKELIFPGDIIHHNLNQCATATGRLSGTNPNLQNIPSEEASEIKRFFISRFYDKGYILEVDFSQLEVVWQAFVSGDTQMKKDIMDGVDFHIKRLAIKEKMDYEEVLRLCKHEELPEWVEKRKKIKNFSFQRAYGAGATAIAASTGLSIEEAKSLIEQEKKLYPQVEEWYKTVQATATVRRREATHTSESGKQLGTGFYQCKTGRAYAFKEYESEYGIGFKPTQIRNYPIQGGATGDMVQIVMGYMNDRIDEYSEIFKDKLFMINQVHDSLVFDCHESVLDKAAEFIYIILTNSPAILKETLGLDFDLPLKVELKYGRNWKNTEVYKFNKE